MRGLFYRHSGAAYYAVALLIAFGVVAQGAMTMIANPDAAAALAYLDGDITNAGGYINIPWIAHFAAQQPSLYGIFLYAGAPSIAALLVAALAGRLPRLMSMLRPWQDGVGLVRGASVYAAILTILAAGFALFSWLALEAKGAAGLHKAFSALGASGLMVIPFAVLGLFLDEGGCLEELGWRGFLMDLFSQRYAPLVCAFGVGVLWWAWHLPREAITLMSGVEPGAFVWGQAVFLLLCVALSIVIAYFWNLVGGSVWVGVLIHGGTNLWSKALSPASYEMVSGWLGGLHPLLATFDLRTLIIFGLAIAILVIAGPRLGARRG